MKILAIDEDKTALSCLVHAIREAVPEAEIRELSKANRVMRVIKEEKYDVVMIDTDSLFFRGGVFYFQRK